jgi:DNA-binding response OmpR family regulator
MMPPESVLQGKKILIIEDDYSYRIFLQSILKKSGALCTISINAEYAKIKLASEQFDILVIDYLLPGHNALEIIKWVREQNILTPAVIVTAYPSDDLTEKSRKEIKVAVLTKSNITGENFPLLLADTLNNMTS